jgi:hypothetical protein
MNRLNRLEKIGIIGGGIVGLCLTSSIIKFWDDYPDIYIFDPRFDDRRTYVRDAMRSCPSCTNRRSGLVCHGWAGSHGIPHVDPVVIDHTIDTITLHKGEQKVEATDPLGRKMYIINRTPVRHNGEVIPSIYQYFQRSISRRERIHPLPFIVTDIRFPQGSNKNFTILCTDHHGTTRQETVNGVVFTTMPPTMKKTLSQRIGYRPPRTWPGAMFDVSLEREQWPQKYQTLHKFFVGGGHIHTIDLIPRRDTLTVMALGKGATLPFLYQCIDKNVDIQKYLPDHWRTRIVEGSAYNLNVPVSAAKNVISDGIVGVGGQVFGEHLINGGLYSNLWAGELLAKALKKGGFCKEELRRMYFAQVMKVLCCHNIIGKSLYMLTDRFVLPSARAASFLLQKIATEKKCAPEKRLVTRFAWDILLGEEPFSRALIRVLQGFAKNNL